MADVANLQILDEATKPSSSQSSENNEISLKVRQQPDDNGSAKTKEEIVAERKAKVAETKARKGRSFTSLLAFRKCGNEAFACVCHIYVDEMMRVNGLSVLLFVIRC